MSEHIIPKKAQKKTPYCNTVPKEHKTPKNQAIEATGFEPATSTSLM